MGPLLINNAQWPLLLGLIEESLFGPVRTPALDMFIESDKALTGEMNVGRERHTWRPQDIHE